MSQSPPAARQKCVSQAQRAWGSCALPVGSNEDDGVVGVAHLSPWRVALASEGVWAARRVLRLGGRARAQKLPDEPPGQTLPPQQGPAGDFLGCATAHVCTA